MASQVKAWPPPTAIAPMVSTTTMAEIRKKTVSSRPSTRRSFLRSAALLSAPSDPAAPAGRVTRRSSAAIAGTREPEARPGGPRAAPVGDGGHRGHGLIDLVRGVVEVEAQPAAGGRVQPERVVGQRGAVAARPGLDPGPVQALGQG